MTKRLCQYAVRRGLLCVLTSAVALTSCARVRVAKGDPTRLIDGFTSFESPTQATERLKAGGLQWRVVEDSRRTAPAGAPAFEKHIIGVQGYRHHGCRGDLLLQFHNARLMETVFFPDDRAAYLKALQTEGFSIPVTPNATGAQAISPPPPAPRFTQIRAANDSSGRFYVSWIDTRLEDEYQDWIAAYA